MTKMIVNVNNKSQGRIQTFKGGGYTLELQLQPGCKLKTKKKKGHHLLTIATLTIDALTNYISLFITDT